MAESENGSAEAAEERRPTERVILEQIAAVVVPRDATAEQVDAAVKALATKGTRRPERGQAWREVARHTGARKSAIEAHTGKAGTPDAKVGTFKAPSVTAWKGGLVLEAPPQPLVTARELDE